MSASGSAMRSCGLKHRYAANAVYPPSMRQYVMSQPCHEGQSSIHTSTHVCPPLTQVRTTQASQAETLAALKAAKKEAVEASTQAASARKDAAGAQRSLEKAQARINELEAQRAEVGACVVQLTLGRRCQAGVSGLQCLCRTACKAQCHPMLAQRERSPVS